jgi:hypothetical protein
VKEESLISHGLRYAAGANVGDMQTRSGRRCVGRLSNKIYLKRYPFNSWTYKHQTTSARLERFNVLVSQAYTVRAGCRAHEMRYVGRGRYASICTHDSLWFGQSTPNTTTFARALAICQGVRSVLSITLSSGVDRVLGSRPSTI